MSAPPVNADGQHPEYGHLMMVFFDLNGRMQWQEKPSRCSSPEAHVGEITVKAVFVEDVDRPDAPPGASAWMVHAGAPDAETAQKTARTVAKALGADLNPVLSTVVEGRGVK